MFDWLMKLTYALPVSSGEKCFHHHLANFKQLNIRKYESLLKVVSHAC